MNKKKFLFYFLIIFIISPMIASQSAIQKKEIKHNSHWLMFGASAFSAYLGVKSFKKIKNPWPWYALFLEKVKPEAFSHLIKKTETKRQGESVTRYFFRQWDTSARLRRHIKRVHGNIFLGLRVGGAIMSGALFYTANSLWKKRNDLLKEQYELEQKNKN